MAHLVSRDVDSVQIFAVTTLHSIVNALEHIKFLYTEASLCEEEADIVNRNVQDVLRQFVLYSLVLKYLYHSMVRMYGSNQPLIAIKCSDISVS